MPREVSFTADAEKKEPDLAQILAEMEADLARDVGIVTAERSAFEEAEKVAQEAKLAADSSADSIAKIEAAAMEMARLAEQSLEASPDRLKTIKVRRRSKDLEAGAKDLLGTSLESVFKEADLNGNGTLDREEVEAAFKNSGTLSFSDESLQPVLEEFLEKHGGKINFEQFKDIAWKASVSSAPRGSPNPIRSSPTIPRPSTFIV